MDAAETADFVVTGGGIVGSAIALGLARSGVSVLMLDEGNGFNASRGNYGLVWLQGKGRGAPAYVSWLRKSSSLWAEYAGELGRTTGIDVGYKPTGGISLALTDAELESQIAALKQVDAETSDGFSYSVLDSVALKEFYPRLGEKVKGGIFCPYDAIVDPLKLLFAQYDAFRCLGGRFRPFRKVTRIAHQREGGFEVITADDRFVCGSVVLAAGLGTEALARDIGCTMPLQPVQGQLLITERTAPVFDVPTLHARQMPTGGILLGLSHEHRGFDTTTDIETVRNVAARCVAAFPFLEELSVVRSWASLRIMTPDGLPVYAVSGQAPGAFAVASHSGVTLAAAHAMCLADSMLSGAFPAELTTLSEERFVV